MNNILAFDTEYNKNKEILSLGLATNNSLNEIYFKNIVDKYSFKIHNLANSFLNKKGLNFSEEKEKIHNEILSFDFIVGFNLEEDLSVLKFKKITHLYANHNFIDLKILFDYLGFSTSLVKIGNLFDLNKLIQKDLSPHNASYDSKLTLLILNKIIDFGKENNINEFELLNNLKTLTTLKHFKYIHELDSFITKFKWLKLIIKELIKYKKISLKDNIEINEFLTYIHINDSDIFILNNNFEICYKMPILFVNLDLLIDLKKIDKLDIKYKEIGYRFNKDFVKEKNLLFKFC